MRAVYFKTDTSGPFGAYCTADGKIDFAALSRKFGLDPMTIELNESGIPKTGLKSEAKWEQIKDDFKEDGFPLGAKDDLVLVTGKATGDPCLQVKHEEGLWTDKVGCWRLFKWSSGSCSRASTNGGNALELITAIDNSGENEAK